MKVNEKNLIFFSTCDTPIDREGWLLKRGEVNKNFQRRWFVLKGNLLFYFDKKTDKEPVGVIILEGCTIELAENEDQFSFKIVFHGNGGRTYIIGADTQENMEAWMKVLACASYDYMKLMVAELQRQLDELTDAERHKPIPPARSRVRVNPFDRRKSDDGLIKKVENQCSISTPNTPVPCRPAPLPPSLTSSGSQCVKANTTTYPNSTSNLIKSETQSSSSDSKPTVIKKSFHEVHEEYGKKIKAYLMANGSANDALF